MVVVMKDFDFVDLYDVYGPLLTEHQRALVEGYYLYDLSFSELAEDYGGSRQSVYDAVKKARALLSDYEAKLGFVQKTNALKSLASELSTVNEELSQKLYGILTVDEK